MTDGSFSVDVIKRILSVLSNEGDTKKTVLAGKTGLNYAALVRYISFLGILRWVSFSSNSGSGVSITPLGRNFKNILEEEMPDEISEDVLNRLLMQVRDSEKARPMSPEAISGPSAKAGNRPTCLFCGNTIKARSIAKEIDGETYFFDKHECIVLFTRFRDLYGNEFPS